MSSINHLSHSEIIPTTIPLSEGTPEELRRILETLGASTRIRAQATVSFNFRKATDMIGTIVEKVKGWFKIGESFLAENESHTETITTRTTNKVTELLS